MQPILTGSSLAPYDTATPLPYGAPRASQPPAPPCLMPSLSRQPRKAARRFTPPPASSSASTEAAAATPLPYGNPRASQPPAPPCLMPNLSRQSRKAARRFTPPPASSPSSTEPQERPLKMQKTAHNSLKASVQKVSQAILPVIEHPTKSLVKPPKDLMGLLQKVGKENWAFTGGYALHLWAMQAGLATPRKVRDFDVLVSSNKYLNLGSYIDDTHLKIHLKDGCGKISSKKGVQKVDFLRERKLVAGGLEVLRGFGDLEERCELFDSYNVLSISELIHCLERRLEEHNSQQYRDDIAFLKVVQTHLKV